MSYLKATKNGTSYRFSLKPASDAASGLFPAVKTHNTANGNFSGLLSNVTLYAGRTYYVKVKFRTRGDGNSTSSKCSSVGFIAYWNNWGTLRSYIHNSATAYAEIGKIVEWTYSFTVDSDVTPQGTSLCFIIGNDLANGNDAQTIDLFYYKYWDSEGNVYDEEGHDFNTVMHLFRSWTQYASSPLLNTDITIPRIRLYSGIYYQMRYLVRNTSTTDTLRIKIICYSEIAQTTVLELGGYIPPNSYRHFIGTVLGNGGYFRFYYAHTASEEVAKIYVRNFKIYQYENTDEYEFTKFLKISKDGDIYYSVLRPYSSQLRLTKDTVARYLSQSASLYKYSELTSYTCGTLTDNFEY